MSVNDPPGAPDAPAHAARLYAPLVVLAGWGAFVVGLVWQIAARYAPFADTPRVWIANALTPALAPVAIGLAAALAWRLRAAWQPGLRRMLDAHTDSVDALPAGRVALLIALTAGAGLFAELMIIRVHGSFFQLFAYYKNLSLLSCFLGLGIGFALGSRRPLATPLVLPGLAAQIGLLHALRFFGLGPFLQNPVQEQSALGLDPVTEASHALTAYGFLLAVFATNALVFIPLGHVTSRLMLRVEKLAGYGWNLLGSLGGIAMFTVVSFAWTPPSVWIAVLLAALIPVLRGRPIQLLASSGSVAALVVLLGLAAPHPGMDVYSPYQVLTVDTSSRVTSIAVNNSYFQRLLDLRPQSIGRSATLASWANYYATPYAVKPEPMEVLVVGAGTGNDVAAAIRNGAGHVDAVEIDPAIQQIGRALHPEAPYASARVTPIVDDARSFMRHASKHYDLIVYGLLDSHTLLSGMSNVRLDTYVYTVEAFREARDRLAPDGVICLTFTLVSDSIGRKLFLMLEEAFDGGTPRVLWSNYDRGVTFLIGEATAKAAIDALALPSSMRDVTAHYSDPAIPAEMSTDDWPFFYMPGRTYPASYVAVIGLLLCASLLLVAHYLPRSEGGFSLPCFFLGAGFMLLETKAITELALVFGSTWVVVSATIVSILVMAYFANLLIAKIAHPRSTVAYGLLLLSLVVCWQLTGLDLSGVGPGWTRLWLTLFLTTPLFFAGIAFSTELKTHASVPGALSANLIGSMLGGFLEYNSMYFGFESLWFLAIAMYAAAWASGSLLRPGASR